MVEVSHGVVKHPSLMIVGKPRYCKCGKKAWYRVGFVGYCQEHRRLAEDANKRVLNAYMKFKWDWWLERLDWEIGG